MTNYERIKNYNILELATFLSSGKGFGCQCCIHKKSDGGTCPMFFVEECKKGIHQWLLEEEVKS